MLRMQLQVVNGILIRKLRYANGDMTQAELSYETGVDATVINRLESGDNFNPSFLSMVAIADYFGLSLESFYQPMQVPKAIGRKDRQVSLDYLVKWFRKTCRQKYKEDVIVATPGNVPQKKKKTVIVSNQLQLSFIV